MLSYIIPFHKDFEKIFTTIKHLEKKKTEYNIKEILLCHNGHPLADSDLNKIENFIKEKPDVHLLHTSEVGIGAGYKLGIENASQEISVLSASDLPFGFTDIESFFKEITQPLFAVGSKGHPSSQIEGYGLKRRVASYGLWILRRILLTPNTPRDSQGSLIIRTDLAQNLLKNHHFSNDYIFSLELITYAQKEGNHVTELPVVLENHSAESSVSLSRDSFKVFLKLLKLSRSLKK